MPTLANNTPSPEETKPTPSLDPVAALGVVVSFPDEPPLVRRDGLRQWIHVVISVVDGPQDEDHQWTLGYPTDVGAERPSRDDVLNHAMDEARGSMGSMAGLARILGEERFQQLFDIVFPPPPKPVFTASSVAPDAIEIDQALALGIKPRYLGIYTVDRNYGGPEEGGWYYDWYDHVESVVTTGLSDAAVEAQRGLVKAKHAEKAWGNISSVLGGLEIRVLIEDEPGHYQSLERPRYE